MDVEQEVQRFRMTLLRKMPFYGDVVMRLPFAANPAIRTARTNGYQIEYSPRFLAGLKPEQRSYVLMHELLHVILMHCGRCLDRDPELWNVASDMVVNHTLDRMRMTRGCGIALQRPPDGIFCQVNSMETVEDLYEKLRQQNQGRKKGQVIRYVYQKYWGQEAEAKIKARDDLIIQAHGTAAGQREEGTTGPDWSAALVEAIVREALEKNRGDVGSYLIPEVLLKPRARRLLNWKQILRSFLTEEISEESSYITPERKYIHMDLILPGYSREEEALEEIWAFVDSSGSISMEELEKFLTQLAGICKEFKCAMNICYWDTELTDVYKHVSEEKKIWECLPRHSGGTDINCVYRWLRKERLRPRVMLILTDGYFGNVQESDFIPSLKNNTILVLSSDLRADENLRRIGKIARL